MPGGLAEAPGTERPRAAPEAGARHEEVELKLGGDATRLAAIFDDLPGGRVKSAQVVSTYYDTPDGRLRRRGFSLRLRRKGKGFELTLKRQHGDTLRRGEWTAVLVEPVADIALLPSEAPRNEIGTVLPEELAPLFSTDIRRTSKKFDAPGAMIEAALDSGHIVAGDRAAPIDELELELLEGSLPAMLRCLRSALGRRSFTLGSRSKADRGRELAEDVPPPAVKAVKPVLDPADSVDAAVRKIVRVTATQIIANLAAADDGQDPEGVHQLRVALRRLRSALTLFKGRLSAQAGTFRDNAKRALQMLGPARDLDVFLSGTLPPVVNANSDDPGLRRLGRTAQESRRDAYAQVRKLIADGRFNRFVIDLLIAAEDRGLVAHGGGEPLRPAAVKLLQKRHRKVLKLGRGFADLATEQRHEVRIALKKLRYACDYFQTLFEEKPTRAYLKRLAALQDDLGRLNDASVAEALAQQLAAGDAEATIGAALIRGWYRHHLQTVEPHMLNGWRRFAEAEPFWQS